MESNKQQGIEIENGSKRSNGTVNFDQTSPTKKSGPPWKVDLFFETFPFGLSQSIQL